MARIKTLCVCAGGVVRSVTLASLLKFYWKHDALAAGFVNEPETLDTLFRWADHIYVVQEYMKPQVPEEYQYKTRVLDVGDDVWGQSMHPELTRICYKLLEQELGPDRKTAPVDELLAKREERYAVRRKPIGKLF